MPVLGKSSSRAGWGNPAPDSSLALMEGFEEKKSTMFGLVSFALTKVSVALCGHGVLAVTWT
jgi:hypothetical protein